MAKKNSRQLSFVGKNIKKIRQAKNISQSDFAGLFHLSRPGVGAYEEGRSEPKIKTLMEISEHFGISIDIILTRELTSGDIFRLGIVNKKLDEAHRFESHVSDQKLVPLVSVGDYIDFLVKHRHKDFPDRLPKIALPPGERDSCIVFEMEGNEMEYDNQGLFHGDFLYCKPLSLLSSDEWGHDKIVVIMTDEYIKIRRTEAMDDRLLIVNADNPGYSKLEIAKEKIIKIWEVRGRYTGHFKSPSSVEKRLQMIEEKLKQMDRSAPDQR